MKVRPAEEIVAFLSFSSGKDCVPDFGEWTPRQCKRILQWLDDSGLAFYFLQRLKDRGATSAVPADILERLETSFASNQERTDDLRQRFDTINARFADAGISFAVLKGFSLVPQFCPMAALRYQGDLDYLVDEHSLAPARRVLNGLGYTEKKSKSSHESIFLSPGAKSGFRGGKQYSLQAPHAVELHLDVWDESLHGVFAPPRPFSPNAAWVRAGDGETFPSLSDPDEFLLQVLHACNHLFTHWIRMSCLLEIAYFLNQRSDDWDLWNRVEERVGRDLKLREFAVIIAEMAARLFDCPIPGPIHRWGASLRPGPRLWLERYSRSWAFADIPVHEFDLLPESKLVLFLRQQYRSVCPSDSTAHPSGRRGSRPRQMLASITRNPALIVNLDWWQRQLLARRIAFHVMAGLRYVCEIPRWQWRFRNMTRAVMAKSSEAAPVSDLQHSKNT